MFTFFYSVSCPSYITSPITPKTQLQLTEAQETKPQSSFSTISLPSSPNKQVNTTGVNPIKYKVFICLTSCYILSTMKQVQPIVIPEANLLDHKCIGASSTPSQSKNPMTPNRIISPANSPKLPAKGLAITPKRSALTISSRTSSMPTPTQVLVLCFLVFKLNKFSYSVTWLLYLQAVITLSQD